MFLLYFFIFFFCLFFFLILSLSSNHTFTFQPFCNHHHSFPYPSQRFLSPLSFFYSLSFLCLTITPSPRPSSLTITSSTILLNFYSILSLSPSLLPPSFSIFSLPFLFSFLYHLSFLFPSITSSNLLQSLSLLPYPSHLFLYPFSTLSLSTNNSTFQPFYHYHSFRPSQLFLYPFLILLLFFLNSFSSHSLYPFLYPFSTLSLSSKHTFSLPIHLQSPFILPPSFSPVFFLKQSQEQTGRKRSPS